MSLLQNSAIPKTMGTIKGSSAEKMNTFSAVESVETFASASARMFLARTICDPTQAGVGLVDNRVVGKGELSYNGACWKGLIWEVGLGPCTPALAREWVETIDWTRNGALVVYADSSINETGHVSGG